MSCGGAFRTYLLETTIENGFIPIKYGCVLRNDVTLLKGLCNLPLFQSCFQTFSNKLIINKHILCRFEVIWRSESYNFLVFNV